MEGISTLRKGAEDRRRRRWVWRGIVTEDVIDDVHTIRNLRQRSRYLDHILPSMGRLEVEVPLSLIGASNRSLIMVADNKHRSDVPEWDQVYNSWQNSYSRPINPLATLESAIGQFELTRRATEEDIDNLAEIWRPFGWNRDNVTVFITETQNRPNIWFSGVRERNSGRLVSACQGEGINFGEITLVEDTEFGTSSEFKGRGLCTAAVIGLNGQILQDVGRSNLPLIYSELSMTTRSDLVARKAGMTIPLVENQQGLREPTQVLRRNVSISDGREQNDLSPIWVEVYGGLGSSRSYCLTDGENYRYWRNFIAGILSASAIERYYTERQVNQILSYYKE